MVGLIGGRGSAFDYIGPDLPNNPQNGEMWFDTDAGSDGSGEVKVYDGANGAWEATGFTSHADLTDVTRSAHHPPVSVSGPLTQPTDQSLGLSIGSGLANSNGTLVAALGNGLGIDANGNVYIPAGAVGTSELGFDPATQTELDGHAGDTTNPHNVTDDQTGAASALSTHAGNAAAHHAKPTSTGGIDNGELIKDGSAYGPFSWTNGANVYDSDNPGNLWDGDETTDGQFGVDTNSTATATWGLGSSVSPRVIGVRYRMNTPNENVEVDSFTLKNDAGLTRTVNTPTHNRTFDTVYFDGIADVNAVDFTATNPTNDFHQAVVIGEFQMIRAPVAHTHSI